jgi:hypothetical protein
MLDRIARAALAAFACACLLQGVASTQTGAPVYPTSPMVGTYPYGSVYGLALNADGSRAYVSEGASIAAIDTTAMYQTTGNKYAGLLTRIPVDATIMGLAVDEVPTDNQQSDPYDDWLFVAGGDFGLLRVNLNAVPTSPPGSPSD